MSLSTSRVIRASIKPGPIPGLKPNDVGLIVIGGDTYQYQHMSETPVGLFLREKNQHLETFSLGKREFRVAYGATVQGPKKS